MRAESGGKYATLRRNTTYKHRNGTEYRCVRAVPGDSIKGILPIATLRQLQSKLTFTAFGTIKYPDGSISWDWTSGGEFEEQL